VSSQIIETNPTSGSATTSSVRDNFGFAKKEINDLQKISTMFSRTAGSGSAYTASFTDQFETDALVDGARVTVEIHTISTSTTPTLTVTAGGTGTGAKTIVKAGSAGGSALVAGDLKEDAIIDLMYVASGGDGITDKWVWLNSVSDSANLVSPALSGTPTAPTAAEDTNTTQIATTAFVQAATPDASASVKGIAELATAAEVIAGTDASRILTPENLLRVAVSNAAVSSAGDQGSIEIAGVVIKWGLDDTTTINDETFTFDTAFPNGCSCVVTQRIKSGATSILGLVSVSAANFVLNRADGISGTESFYFIAIGR
jgi:hypothetical protein